ncbi:MAG: hypothetical protein ACREA9_15040 [Pyrinomonadaceae bacterium]
MTPNALLHAPFLGNAFGGSHPWSLEELLGSEAQKSLDPKSLQQQKFVEQESPERSTTPHRQSEPRFFEEGLLQKLASPRQRPLIAIENVAPTADSLLNESARQIIGENGLNRLREFTGYQRGWDLGRGKPLALRSVVILDAFLAQLPQLAAYRPSLFMTHEGNLELGSEDAMGRSISIEFYPDKLDYYLEGLAEEQTVKVDLIPQLIEKVRALISQHA